MGDMGNWGICELLSRKYYDRGLGRPKLPIFRCDRYHTTIPIRGISALMMVRR